MKSLFVLLISIILFIPAFAQNSNENLEFAQQKLDERGEFFFYFRCNSSEVIRELNDFIWIDKQMGTTFYAYATPDAFEIFLTYGIEFEPVESYYDQTRALNMATSTAQMVNWDRYPTHAVYLEMLDDFAANYPDLCRVETIGSSENGVPIKCLVISDNINTDEDEPEFWWSGTMHGDETTGYILLLRLADYLLSNYGSDTQVTTLVNEIEIYINPLANPDGTFNNSPGLDDVSNSIRANSNNIDLNRNFPTLDGSSYTLQDEITCMMDYATAHDFVMSVNTHGGTELMNYPWDTWQSDENLHPDTDWWIHVAFTYADQVELDAPASYFEGPGTMYDGSTNTTGVTHGADWYYAIGSRQDYMNYYQNCREITLEVSDTKTLGTEYLNTYWDYNKQAMLDYTEQVLYGLRGVVTDACTGNPLSGVKVEIGGHDQDNTEVYSSAPVGNYHRPIYAGTYDFTFSLDGYQSQTHTVTVTNDDFVRLNIELVPDNVATPDFSADETNIFEGTEVNFTDMSTGTVDSYNWTLIGGSPNISTVQNPSSTYNTAGTYDVQLEITSQGCTISELKENYITVSAPAAPVADFSASTTSVNIGGTVDFTDFSTNVPDSWSWTFEGGTPGSSADQNPTVTYNTPGIYTVTLEASNSYGSDTEIKADHIMVVEPDIIMQNGSVTQCGGNFYDPGGTSAYGNDQDFELTIYPSTPGAFVQVEFTVFDLEPNGSDCYDYLSIYDGENSSATEIGTYCGTDHTVIGTDGTVTAGTASGALTFVFSSDGGATQEGWEATVSCYSPTDPPVAAFSAAQTTTCTGEIQFQDESTLATGWSWNFGDGNTSDEQHPLHTYTADGTYTISLTVTNDYGTDLATMTDYITVDMPDAPTVTDAESCAPASLTLSASGDGEINWYDAASGGNLLSTGPDYTDNFSATTIVYAENVIPAPSYSAGKADNGGDGGYYTYNAEHGLIFDAYVDFTLVSVLVYADGAGDRTISLLNSSDTEIAGTTVNIPDGESRVVLNFEVPAGTNYKLMGSGAPNLYRNGSTSSPGLAYPFTVSGILSVTSNTADNDAYYYYFYDWDVKVGEDCISARVPVTATIYDLPSVDLGDDQGICDGSTYTFDAGNGFSSYAWTPSGSDQTYEASDAGNYVVVVEDANGCTATDDVNLTVNPNPTVSLSSVPENGNNSDGSITATAADGQPPYEYVWFYSTGPVISGLSAGTYCVTVSDINGCIVIGCEELTSTTPSPVAEFTADITESCGSLTVQFTDLSTNTPDSWSWDFGDGNTSTDQNPQHTYSTAGTYTVSLTSTGIYGSDEEIKTDYIVVYDELIVSDGNASVSCYGESNAVLIADVSGGEGTYTYHWETESGSVLGSNETLNGVAAGTYYLTVNDAAGCSDNGVYTVVQPDELILTLDVTHESSEGACDGSIQPSVTGGSAPCSYVFEDASSTVLSDLDGLCAGEYFVTVIDSNGCGTSGSETVNAGPLILIADFFADVSEGCEDLDIQFTDASTGGAVSWAWAFGDGGTSYAQNPEYTYTEPGLYTVELTVENASTETDVESKTGYILVKDRPEIGFEIIHESSASASDGEITVIITGDDTPYDINWSNGGDTETISGLSGGFYSVAVTGDNGCPATGVAEVQTLTGVELGNNDETLLYPNPVQSVLAVETASPVDMLSVLSVDGRLIKQIKPESLQFSVQMPETAGVYIVILEYTSGQAGRYRVVVE